MRPVQRLLEITEDWNAITRRDGWKVSLRTIVSDIARLPYRHLRFITVARSLLDPFPALPPKPGLTIRPFEQADIALVRQIDRFSEARLCAERLAQDHKGLIALMEGRPAGYAWGSTDLQTRLERVHPPLNPGDVLCTDSYTAPAFRGRGIQTALTLARFHLFKELGYCRAVCYIEVGNGPSLAVWQRKFDSQAVGSIDFLRIGPWYKVRYS
jgi:ribosomal protein S18 acetylase RimI-like enzyme